MKVFANKQETFFFKTDKYLKNLHPVDIDSVEDFIRKYSLDPRALLGTQYLLVTRFDELVVRDFYADEDVEVLEIDFLADIKPFDLLIQLFKYITVNSDLVDAVAESDMFTVAEREGVECSEITSEWVIQTPSDYRKLVLLETDFDTYTYFIEHK